jgi:hypothetical protein
MSHERHELQPFVTPRLPPTRSVRLTEVTVGRADVLLQLTTTTPALCCPCCAVPSSSVHSRDQRHLTDLPRGMRPVRLQLTGRKFVCRHPTCRRRLFTECVPELVAAYARKTQRLMAAPRETARPRRTGLEAAPPGLVQSRDGPAPRHGAQDRRAVSPGANLPRAPRTERYREERPHPVARGHTQTVERGVSGGPPALSGHPTPRLHGELPRRGALRPVSPPSARRAHRRRGSAPHHHTRRAPARPPPYTKGEQLWMARWIRLKRRRVCPRMTTASRVRDGLESRQTFLGGLSGSQSTVVSERLRACLRANSMWITSFPHACHPGPHPALASGVPILSPSASRRSLGQCLSPL